MDDRREGHIRHNRSSHSITASALSWYEKLFGPSRQVSPSQSVLEMEIIPNTWLQFMNPSGDEIQKNVLRVGVEDLSEELQRLEHKGFKFEPVVTFALTPHGILKLAYINDPDCNRVCLYQMILEASEG